MDYLLMNWMIKGLLKIKVLDKIIIKWLVIGDFFIIDNWCSYKYLKWGKYKRFDF